MKKRVLYSIMIVAASLAFPACSSFLDETPIDQMPEGEAYKNPTLVYLNTVANLYTQIGADAGGAGLAGTDRGLYDLNTFSSDEAMLPTRGGDWGDGGLWRDLFQHKWGTKTDLIKGSWDYLYKVIGQCNQSIDKLNELLEKDRTNAALISNKSEIRAIRAMYYYYLLDMYARVPIVETSKIQMSEVKQSKRSEVFAFVKKELEEIMPDLKNANSSKPGEYYGRITLPVAHFLMAKLALNAEVYTDDDWTDATRPDGKEIKFNVGGTEKNCWEATLAYCDLIAGAGYSLRSGISGFSENFATNNETSVENIFVIPMDPILYKARMMYLIRSRHYEHGKAYNQGGWNGASATLEALNTFGQGKDNVDPRFAATYYSGKVTGPDGNIIKNGAVDLEYVSRDVKLDLSGATNEKTAGARMFKYELDKTAEADGQLVHNDYVLFRYADVVLMKAEATLRNTGDKTLALEPLNEIRTRVGATAYSAADVTLDTILKERLLELAWEGVRRQDLIRFGQFNKAITDRPATEPYRTVFPIHEDVLALNAQNLTQNPGYNK